MWSNFVEINMYTMMPKNMDDLATCSSTMAKSSVQKFYFAKENISMHFRWHPPHKLTCYTSAVISYTI